MEIYTNGPATQPSALVAPTQDSFPVFGDADMATGHRPWRHLIS
jgi:hypothetical protein